MQDNIWKSRIMDYLKRNHVSTTEVTDCLGKTGNLENMNSIIQGNYKVGSVKWVYGYNESNWDVHEQVRDVNEGEIVFIETFNCGKRAIIGELVSKYILVYRQAAAIISNSPFRDANNLLKERYSIWCNGFTPVGCFNKENKECLDENIIREHREKYDGAIAVCDDSGVVIIKKELFTEEFFNKLCNIEEQEDIWFDCLDRLKWNTFDIVCKKKYLTQEGE